MRMQSTSQIVLFFFMFSFPRLHAFIFLPLVSTPSASPVSVSRSPAITLLVLHVALELHSLCQLLCHSMKSLGFERPLFLSISRGTIVSHRKKIACVPLRLFRAYQYRSRIISSCSKEDIEIFFLENISTHERYCRVHIKMYISRRTNILSINIMIKTLRELTPSNIFVKFYLRRPIWRITESLEFNFQWQGGWLMFCGERLCRWHERANLHKLRPQDPFRRCIFCFSEIK